jgi:uncharacterized protein (TIGR03546 family)
MTLLALLRKLLKALNSEGTPGQVAAGIALGAVFGLTPLFSLHNLLLIALGMVLHVSLAGVFLGWALFVPVGFLLDPLFDTVGARLLLEVPFLASTWTGWYNTPVLALTGFNNTIVLGSFLTWLVLLLPLYFLARFGVKHYRESLYERINRSRLFRTVKASKAFGLYRSVRRVLRPD